MQIDKRIFHSFDENTNIYVNPLVFLAKARGMVDSFGKTNIHITWYTSTHYVKFELECKII